MATLVIAKFLHILGFTVWVGGMFFAHNALRPSAATLEPPVRLPLLLGVFNRFFAWVWVAVILILGSGLYMMSQMGKPPAPVTAMAALGIVMIAVFGHIFFAPYRRMRQAVAAQDWPAGNKAMATIRKLVALNLLFGLLTIAIGALGPLFY